MIKVSANQILHRNLLEDLPRIVNKTWVYEFIKRLPEEFKLIKQKPRDKICLDTEDIGLLQY
jgi:hypothetical protein